MWSSSPGLDLGRAARRDRRRRRGRSGSTSASRGRPSSLTWRPTAASPSAHLPDERLAAELGARSRSRPTAAAARARRSSTPRRCASGSKVAPWIRVELTTTKKIALKITSAALDPGDHREGREPDRDRAAQAGPAQHHPFSSARSARTPSRPASRAAGRRRSAPPRAAAPRAATSPRPLGNTSRPSRTKSEIWATQREPLVERDRRLRVPGPARCRGSAR